jgi:hypothetical protein
VPAGGTCRRRCQQRHDDEQGEWRAPQHDRLIMQL